MRCHGDTSPKIKITEETQRGVCVCARFPHVLSGRVIIINRNHHCHLFSFHRIHGEHQMWQVLVSSEEKTTVPVVHFSVSEGKAGKSQLHRKRLPSQPMCFHKGATRKLDMRGISFEHRAVDFWGAYTDFMISIGRVNNVGWPDIHVFPHILISVICFSVCLPVILVSLIPSLCLPILLSRWSSWAN